MQQFSELLAKALHEEASAPANGDPFHVTLTMSGIEITGRIDSAERADELVRAVNALKPLLAAVVQPARSNGATSQATTSASVAFMITAKQKKKLQALGYGEDCVRDMKPEAAHDLLKNSG